jgi:uncharacterized protein YdeI (YjbR/CyaY-like superfamily)
MTAAGPPAEPADPAGAGGAGGAGAAVEAGPDGVPRVHASTGEQWRAWLLANCASARSAWLVSWRASTGRPAVGYEDAVTQALSVGWVDSKQVPLDDERTMLYFSRRRRGSGWAGTNKRRIAALERDGLMTDAGRAVVDAAKADGSWTLLDDVERLVVPPDLAGAFDAVPGSRARWEAFPPSARRALLEWIALARRPETRARRVAETAERAGSGERANSPRPG